MVKDKRVSKGGFIEWELPFSTAYRGLNSHAKDVLWWFWSRRVMEKDQRGRWGHTNNGELVYTYAQAKRNGISQPAFTRALDNLLERGFLDIARTGAGQFKAVTLYALSERWRKFGKPDFIKAERPKKKQWSAEAGFQKSPRLFGSVVDGTL